MDAIQALRIGINCGEMICKMYVDDLTDAEMMLRPAPGCNHVNWQLGHLISSEHHMLEQIFPGSMPPLPAGFVEKYDRANAASDDPSAFLSKAELMQTFQAQRAATLAALDQVNPADLELPSGVSYAPTVAEIFSLQGSHWLMHAGQWAVVRRIAGRSPLM
ncbi:DinB family protein [Planctomicrobium sp. SH661]|uniref:DinB family protein n=1 Tax=Planctomicrobium sp. SH661 TaxID=3448124 RepID=UPI003F5BB153